MGLENLFFGIGTIILLKLVWEDLKTRQLDARNSSVMFGIVMALFYIAGNYIYLLYYAIILVLTLKFYDNHIKPKLKGLIYLGKGDISILTWVMPGFFIIHWLLLPFFLMIYLIINLIQTVCIKEKYPGTISILIAFVLTWAIHNNFILVSSII